MKQVGINSLLETRPLSGVTFQKEWSIWSGLRGNGMFLIVALFAGNIGPGLFMISYLSKFYLNSYFYIGFPVSFFIVFLGYSIPHVLFLGRKTNFWRAIFKPQNSWISRGTIFAVLFLFFSFFSAIPYFDLGDYNFLKTSSTLYNVILICGFISAFLLSLYPGFLFSVVTSIPFWNSIYIVPLFVIQSFGAGIALALILTHLPGIYDPGIIKLFIFEAVIITASAILIILYLYNKFKAEFTSKESVKELLSGRYMIFFLFGAILFEIIIPMIMVLVTLFGIDLEILILAEFIQLFGIFIFKYCFLHVGAYKPILSDEVLFLNS